MHDPSGGRNRHQNEPGSFFAGRLFFLLIFVALGTLIAGSFTMVYFAEYREIESRVALQGAVDLQIQEEIITRRISDVLTDIRLLAGTRCLAEGLRTGNYADARETFRILATAKERYAQVRFLNVDGDEVVRVNYDGAIAAVVPEEELQDKSGRYYFVESIGLGEGEIYVSPLDLNVERGQVEEPENPMIRFATPIFIDGRIQGIVVVNYSARPMLEELRGHGRRNMGDFFLINTDGYYLISPDRRQEWGFMYPDRRRFVFGDDHPESWAELQTGGNRVVEDEHGLLTFRHIYPLGEIESWESGYYWTALNLVETEILKGEVVGLRLRLYFLGGFLFLLSVLPAWAISQLISRRARSREELLAAARFDSLTGLPNRRMSLERLRHYIALCRRYRWQGALLFIDLDGFKEVNDRHGHDAGDELLKQVAGRLLEGTRESDTPARFGGDEFLVLVPHEENDPEVLALRLLTSLARPYRLRGVEVFIGASIGLRLITGDEKETPESLIHDADMAMYRAKTSGKGRVVSFDPEQDQD